MHGKKREEYKAKFRDPQVAAGLAQKAEGWHALMKEMARQRGNHNQTTTTLALLEKALLVNPDPLVLWNHRREIIISQQQQQQQSSSKEKEKADDGFLDKELALTQAALGRNPKAYGAWFHRKWVIQQVQPPFVKLQSELALTVQFLKLDERNFHCWNYRRFVVSCLLKLSSSSQSDSCWNGAWENFHINNNNNDAADNHHHHHHGLMGPQIGVVKGEGSQQPQQVMEKNSNSMILSEAQKALWQAEFDFTTTKIQDNFSNFSAFHYRSQLLPCILQNNNKNYSREEQLQTELGMVEDAICTEPDDQTAWWYHAVLLDAYGQEACLKSRLQDQVELLQELWQDASSENNNNGGGGKWILLGWSKVLNVLNRPIEEQQTVLQRLMQVDPDRQERYQELLDRLGYNNQTTTA